MNNESFAKVLREQLAEIDLSIEQLQHQLKAKRVMKTALENQLKTLGSPMSSSGDQVEIAFSEESGLPDTAIIRTVKEVMEKHAGSPIRASAILAEAIQLGFASEAKNPQTTLYWALRHLQRAGIVKRVGKGVWQGVRTT